MTTLSMPADKEHLLALALWHAVEGDASLLNRFVVEIRAAKSTQPDRRVFGLEHAEGIADHWHKRFLLLCDEAEGAGRKVRLLHNAEGAKQVLDEIRAERAQFGKAAP